jgi:hypothetical protein
VRELVLIAALGPDENETSQGQQDNYPKTPAFEHIEVPEEREKVKKAMPYDFHAGFFETA